MHTSSHGADLLSPPLSLSPTYRYYTPDGKLGGVGYTDVGGNKIWSAEWTWYVLWWVETVAHLHSDLIFVWLVLTLSPFFPPSFFFVIDNTGVPSAWPRSWLTSTPRFVVLIFIMLTSFLPSTAFLALDLNRGTNAIVTIPPLSPV